MKLEVKHLSKYLPYKLKCKCMGQNNLESEYVLTGITLDVVDDIVWCSLYQYGNQFIEDIFPILRPMKDVDKIIPHCYLNTINDNEILFEHHFDVYGLIDKKLAFNMNDLK